MIGVKYTIDLLSTLILVQHVQIPFSSNDVFVFGACAGADQCGFAGTAGGAWL
jgi:hypothetical protein